MISLLKNGNIANANYVETILGESIQILLFQLCFL